MKTDYMPLQPLQRLYFIETLSAFVLPLMGRTYITFLLHFLMKLKRKKIFCLKK